MAYSAPSTVATGDLIAAADWNKIVNDIIAMYAGGMSVSGQTALDLVYASSSTQLARIPKGSGLQVLRMNAGATAYEFATPSASPVSLLKCNSGTTNCSGGAQNLDTYAVSGLTVKDVLFYIATLDDTTALTTTIYNSTDSVTLSSFVTASGALSGIGWIIAQGGQTNVVTTRRLYASASSGDNSVAITTAWTSPWTVAWRHPGGGAASVKWQWWLFKIAGQ